MNVVIWLETTSPPASLPTRPTCQSPEDETGPTSSEGEDAGSDSGKQARRSRSPRRSPGLGSVGGGRTCMQAARMPTSRRALGASPAALSRHSAFQEVGSQACLHFRTLPVLSEGVPATKTGAVCTAHRRPAIPTSPNE